MIQFLPDIYPDELVYSWFCRYYVRSGYLSHSAALSDILHKRHNNPSKEFLGKLSPDMIKVIQKTYSVRSLILEHTMYPQYARFLSSQDKENALYRLEYDYCDAHYLFPILPRSEADSHLKYCPICAEEDRQRYGEAYWHRVHQIRNMLICPIHNCRLLSSGITIKSAGTSTFCPAETSIKKSEPVTEENSLVISYSKYMFDVFSATTDTDKDSPITAIIYRALKGTEYIPSTVKGHYTRRLTEDINAYYTKIGISDIASMSQMQDVLAGCNYNFSVLCQVAFYLSISTKDLISPSITETEIEEEKNSHYVKDRPALDRNKLDKEKAPIIEKLAKSVYDGTETGRPERVSKKLICRELGVSFDTFNNMPICRAIFDTYTETYDESWARRVVWGYNKLKESKGSFYWTDIRKLTGVKKKNIGRVLQHIDKYANEETVNAIRKAVVEGGYIYQKNNLINKQIILHLDNKFAIIDNGRLSEGDDDYGCEL